MTLKKITNRDYWQDESAIELLRKEIFLEKGV